MTTNVSIREEQIRRTQADINILVVRQRQRAGLHKERKLLMDALSAGEQSLGAIQKQTNEDKKTVSSRDDILDAVSIAAARTLMEAGRHHSLSEALELETWMARLEGAALTADADFVNAKSKLQILEAMETIAHDALLASQVRNAAVVAKGPETRAAPRPPRLGGQFDTDPL